ncbi:MAG: hypothetical protein ABH864_05270 [archaeon]
MKNSTANNISIAIFLISSLLASGVLGGLFWNILSVAFLISGVYGIVCVSKKQKFIF